MFLQQLQVGSMAVFAYLIGDEKTGEALVVDPAGELDEILSIAEKKHLTIQRIVNTHGHVDHTAGNRDMKARTKADLLVHEADADMLVNTPEIYLRMFGAKQSPPADRTLRDGDILTLGDLALKVLHTPGHSPGSICLYTPGFVLTGDTLFVGAVGRTDLPGGSWPMMHHSLTEVIGALPDDTVVLPGHNYGHAPSSTVAYEKEHNPFMQE